VKAPHLALAALLLLPACATMPHAEPKKGDHAERQALYDEIAGMDRQLFDAFNRHDAVTVKALFAPDLEFYHDTGGKSSRDESMAGIESMFAQNNGIRRDLVPGSLEVYPIHGYGAIEIGSHRFCHLEDGKNDCGTFKFVHVWQKQDGHWTLARVVSYDH
jgi:ketosteroid isomerase-like protein